MIQISFFCQLRCQHAQILQIISQVLLTSPVSLNLKSIDRQWWNVTEYFLTTVLAILKYLYFHSFILEGHFAIFTPIHLSDGYTLKIKILQLKHDDFIKYISEDYYIK